MAKCKGIKCLISEKDAKTKTEKNVVKNLKKIVSPKKTSAKTCKEGQFLMKGYVRKLATPTKQGLKKEIVAAKCVDKPILVTHGYNTKMKTDDRRKKLEKIIKEYGVSRIIWSLNGVRNNKNGSVAKIAKSDQKWAKTKFMK